MDSEEFFTLTNYRIMESPRMKSTEFAVNLTSTSEDAFVLVAGEAARVQRVADALVTRIRYSLNGVPAETRAASIEGETTFLRPRPGSARMYPETDIPLIQISESIIDRLRKEIPEPWDKQVSSFSRNVRSSDSTCGASL